MDSTPNPEDQIQEAEYSFPYHHIPEQNAAEFTQTKHWSWGIRYLGGLQVASNLAGREHFSSLLDVGCGDGRFLKEVKKRNADVILKGIDVSTRAIGYARAFSPDIDFEVCDITEVKSSKEWDLVTLIEVCEHIHPNELNSFIDSATSNLAPEGRIIITVPHTNKKLSPKHYQHFSSTMLRNLLDNDFHPPEFVFFDSKSLSLLCLLTLLGGKGRHLVITSPTVNRIISKIYRSNFLYLSDESKCMRIACVARKK